MKHVLLFLFVANTLFAQLPVELASFTVSKTALTWITESEVDFSHFDIQHSTNGRTWRVVDTIDGTLDGSGNTYTLDVRNVPGVNYYRLKMVDIDYTYEFSNTVAIETTQGQHLVSISGNMLYADNSTNALPGSIWMYNVNTNRFYMFVVWDYISVNLVNMPPGIYVVYSKENPWFDSFKWVKV